MEGNKSGLGTLNLLCIAAEMLLFNNQKKGLKLAIVEELEAHLHPQYQLRLIDYRLSFAGSVGALADIYREMNENVARCRCLMSNRMVDIILSAGNRGKLLSFRRSMR